MPWLSFCKQLNWLQHGWSDTDLILNIVLKLFYILPKASFSLNMLLDCASKSGLSFFNNSSISQPDKKSNKHYPPASEARREVANLTERKNPHTPVYGVKEFVCLSVRLWQFVVGHNIWSLSRIVLVLKTLYMLDTMDRIQDCLHPHSGFFPYTLKFLCCWKFQGIWTFTSGNLPATNGG